MDNIHIYGFSGNTIYGLKKDTTTNVNSDLQNIDLQINPNPTNFNLKLTYVNPKEAKVKIDLINFTGQEVLQLFSGIETQGRIEHNFNLSAIPSSSYAIRISIDNTIYFKNFIKE